MPHRDTVIDRDGIEFLGHAAGFFYFPRNQLPHVLEVDMAGDELGKGVCYRNNRLLEVFILHTGGAPQCAGTGHVATESGGFRAVIRHDSGLVGLAIAQAYQFAAGHAVEQLEEKLAGLF
jgi:hypothetical protein